MNYCYARVSTEEQHLDRQIAEFKNYEPFVLYADKESGKDFDRTNYKKMKRKLKGGDTLIVLSLDRFGRNYDLIKKEWVELNEKGVKIKVIDMPIIDTTSDDLTSKLISDIVMNLLSYVAEMERTNIKKRQAQGIAQAKLRGVKFGRPKHNMPPNFHEVARKYCKKEIDNIKAVELLGLSRGTFFRWLNEYGYKQEPKPIKPKKLSNGEIYRMFLNKEIRTLKVNELLGEKPSEWYPRFMKWKRKFEKGKNNE